MKHGALLVTLAVAGLACAQPQAPPGGDPDVRAPGLVATAPAPLSLVEDLGAPVVFRFDERLRARSFNRTFVSVMPGDPAEMVIDLSGNEIRVRREGGWLPGQIYHVVVRQGIEDRFGNKREDPVELVFSTGPEIPPTALAGVIEDRLTGRPATGAVLEAVRLPDSTTYRTPADSSAFFALRNAPYGAYEVRAYTDRNRNNRLDAGEPRSPVVPLTLAPGNDTTTLALELLPGDTTAPRLVRAETVDSLHVRLTFDDAIDFEWGLDSARAAVLRLPDSTSVLNASRLQLARAWEAERDRARAVEDSLRAAADTSAAPADSVRGRAPARGRAAAQDTATTGPLPDQAVVATLPRVLPPGEYVVRAAGFRNLNRLAGGGTASFTVRAAPAAPDSAALRPPADSVALRR